MRMQSGKVAIVTGASSGIGKATAEAMARAGFTVFGTSRRAIDTGPKQVTMLVCDVTNDTSVNELVSEVLSRTGRIDVLVNNAGLGLFGGAEESSITQAKSLFEVNFFGLVRMTNAVMPSMRKNGGGHIVNISSVLGFLPAPYSAHYGATKHAVEGYSESLDHETRAFGVRVTLIEPAFTKSSFDQAALKPDTMLKEYDDARAGMDKLVQQAMTIGDPPEVVADTVVMAATAARPRRRYPAGKAARQVSFARRFVPAGLFDKSLRKQFGLPV
ncbi:putative homolog short-chain type dehydrogenase/reductase vdlC [Bradyrhizobium sp. ORS 285]|uniref:oxidoreductase n=1 Tax=Bradyrhizobium sp. ORS 285 TaxID=115808 RepID=UPI0002406279|nr:oxidoreductase [Bradyrhizobium sp. ORS 285]CCD89491.1 putative homolog short-chain type dehydrogenase/reductase vdlC [Bradyrhizobium sp. ORS 285]SMX58739.1 putative homolog short-chain type dehydrogenase/reductase vdlC [Bradyrhizobium sp. ORS 285]